MGISSVNILDRSSCEGSNFVLLILAGLSEIVRLMLPTRKSGLIGSPSIRLVSFRCSPFVSSLMFRALNNTDFFDSKIPKISSITQKLNLTAKLRHKSATWRQRRFGIIFLSNWAVVYVVQPSVFCAADSKPPWMT